MPSVRRNGELERKSSKTGILNMLVMVAQGNQRQSYYLAGLSQLPPGQLLTELSPSEVQYRMVQLGPRLWLTVRLGNVQE